MPRDIQTSFTGGEISPGLHERVDMERYQSSLALCKNWFIHSSGGISNRPGFEFVGNAALDSTKKTRLIPFEFNTEQTYALAFTDQKIRVVQNGGLFLVDETPVVTAVTQANPAVVTVSAATTLVNGDEIFLKDIVGMTELNNRFFKVANVTGGSPFKFDLVGIDSTGYAAYISGGDLDKVLEIVSPYLEAELPQIKYTQSADVMTFTHPNHPQQKLTRTALPTVTWTLAAISYASVLAAPVQAAPVLTGTPSGSANRLYGYVITALDDNGNESEKSNEQTINANALSTTGGVKLSWAAVTDATSYYVYKLNSVATGIYGFIGETVSLEFSDFNLGPDMSISPPVHSNPFSSSNYPFCVAFHQQRQFFGGTLTNVQRILASKSGLFENFDYSSPSQATDSIDRSIATKKVNEIRHLISLNTLVMLTSGGEWKIGADIDGVITPDNIDTNSQGERGSSHVTPVVVGDTVLYVQARGGRLRDLNYSNNSDSYSGNDLSIMADHLLKGVTIVDMCFAQEPNSVLWAVRSDGVLLSLTYVREHGIVGWAQHTTDGLFESVTCISEGDEDILYVVVNRTIDGNTVRFIERLHERVYTDVKNAFFVDSGLTYSGAATTTITNLHHLEGETLIALADGNVVTDLIVSGGAITLPDAAEVVNIGLPYNCDLQTLNLSIMGGATMQTRKKSVSRLGLSLRDSRGLKFGKNFDDMYELKERDITMAYDNIPEFTGLKTAMLTDGWTDGARISLRQDLPLPATILAIIPEIEVSG